MCVGGGAQRKEVVCSDKDRERENLITSIKTYEMSSVFISHTDDMVSITYTDFNLKQIC